MLKTHSGEKAAESRVKIERPHPDAIELLLLFAVEDASPYRAEQSVESSKNIESSCRALSQILGPTPPRSCGIV